MHPMVERLYEEKRHAWERAKAILDTAEEEKRDLTAEESEAFDAANADIDAKNERIRQIEAAEARAAAADELRKEYAAVLAPKAGDRDPDDRTMLQRMFAGEVREFESGPETRALTGQAGTAIDSSFYRAVAVYERAIAPVLQVATVLETPRGEPITLPRLTVDVAFGGTVVAEAGTILAADPTLAIVTLNAYKYASITLWSQELSTDNVINLEDLVAQSAARDIAYDIGAHFTTGDGSGKPNGVVTAAAVPATGGTAGGTATGSATDTFFSPFDLVQLYYSLEPGYRTDASWMVATTAAAKMRGARDSNKNFIWEPGALRDAAGVDRFLGKPVYENVSMAAVASATKSVLCGSFSKYFVRRLPTRVELSSDYAFNTDMLAIKVVERMDGDLVDTDAIHAMVSANT